MYTHFEIDRMLDSMTVLVDTREQDTPAFRARLSDMKCKKRREYLNYGDYSAEVINESGISISAANKVSIERKMDIDELCKCFTYERERFKREFERAAEDGAKMYLLVENASWEKIFSGAYRSKMKPEALEASILAWCARYNLTLHFCRPKSTGILIEKILRYEIKVMLEKGEL